MGRCKRFIQHLLRLVSLLLHKLPTDLMLVCQMADRSGTCKGLDTDHFMSNKEQGSSDRNGRTHGSGRRKNDDSVLDELNDPKCHPEMNRAENCGVCRRVLQMET